MEVAVFSNNGHYASHAKQSLWYCFLRHRETELCERYMGKYPVISLSLKEEALKELYTPI